MKLSNINTVARYEVKLLKRSWLFRIFAILMLIILTMMQLINTSYVFGEWSRAWEMSALSSMIPLMTTYTYNVGQSIIVIFLAGSFLKRDKKLDTVEVIYVRPMSNTDYIIGKIWGILRVFLGLNLIPLAFGAVIALALNHSPFSLMPYLFYLFTISLPSLLFVLGMAFFIMNIVNNQAVTFLLMLGFIGTVFFYLPSELFGVFDFFGVHIPTLFSDITGHANISIYLLHRSIYLLSGCGFLALTIAMVKRLPDHPKRQKSMIIVAFALLFAATFIGYEYVNNFKSKIEERKNYINLYNQYAEQPKANVIDNSIIIDHIDDKLSAQCNMTIENRYATELPSIVLYINPGLIVNEIKSNGEIISFTQEKQVVVLNLKLASKAAKTLSIKYEGKPDETICYADIPNEDYYATPATQNFLVYGKRYLYIGSDYTLLTPETMWYPVTIPPVNPKRLYGVKRDYTLFSLTVNKTNKDAVISQGKRQETDNKIIFDSEVPMNGISLAIGDYERESITIDSTDFDVWYFKGNDYFKKPFASLKDTLVPIIHDLKQTAENSNRRAYPYRRFSIVEVPIQFKSYVRNWKGYVENTQPEMVFVPECGVSMNADFKGEIYVTQKWSRDPINEEEACIEVLRNFIYNNFISTIQSIGNGWQQENASINPYCISPMFYTFSTFVDADSIPVFDAAINVMQNLSSSSERWIPFSSGLTSTQRANLYLDEKSFCEATTDSTLKANIFYEILQLKSAYLKNYILSLYSEDVWNKFIQDFYDANRFKCVSFEEYVSEFEKRFSDINFMPLIQDWYNKVQAPCLRIQDVDAKTAIIDDITKYLIKFKIMNTSNCDAVIDVAISSGGGPGMRNRGGESSYNKYFIIPKNSANEVKILSDDRPGRITVNTGVSHNLPNSYNFSLSKVDKETQDLEEGIFSINKRAFAPPLGEIIVDNEDSTFSIVQSNNKQILQKLFRNDDEEKYKGFNPWWRPTKWTAFVNGNYYGVSINSAVYKKKGKGGNLAIWKTNIPKDNYYEIFVWYGANMMGGRRDRNGGNNENNFTYTIKTLVGSEDAIVNYSGRESEWRSLGTFYLPEGEVSVILSDKVSGDMVIADAVKFSLISKKNQQLNKEEDITKIE